MATSKQLKNMLTLVSEPGPFISLFVPANQVNYDTLNRLIINAKQSLRKKDPQQSWLPYQQKLNHLQITRNEQRFNLAIYLGPTVLRVFRLNHPIRCGSLVSDIMWIIPLITESRSFTASKLENNQSVCYNLKPIVELTPAGLINTLLITHKAIHRRPQLMNDLAITTIGFGGHVFIIPNRNRSSIIAICRR